MFSRSRLIHVKGSLGFGLRLIVPETTACLMANLVSHLLSGNSLSSQSYLNNNSYGDYTSRHDTIESSITDESRSIIDANLSPVLDSFINNIKSTIVSKAEAKALFRSNAAEVNGDVSILTGGSTFYDLATTLEAIQGVVGKASLILASGLHFE
eukprot:scaffold69125_cov25-Cyclotella_meneghiniana.AAC.1